MKRGLALFLAALLTALALSACGGGTSGADAGGEIFDSMVSGTASSGSGAPAENYGFTSAESGVYADAEELAEAPAEPLDDQAQEDRLANAKMIYTADIEAETTDFDACSADLETLVEEMGGYLEYASTGSYADGRRSGTYTVRIPSARFQTFLDSVGEIGHITGQDQRAENISEEYYDIESRLVTQRTKLERLQALLAKAENMEDIITLESAIAETELQIEQLTGSLRHYDALVDYATIEVRLREVSRLSAVEETPPTFSSQLGNAFTGGIQAFGDFLQGLAIVLAYNWTWLLLLAVILFLVVRASKRRQARRAETFGGPKVRDESFFHRKKTDETKNPDDKQP